MYDNYVTKIENQLAKINGKYERKNKMTRENYLAFEKALLGSGYIWNVTREDDIITIEPDQSETFYSVYVLDSLDNEWHREVNIIHTEYGDLEWVDAIHSNGKIYSVKYRII